jgi:hypothetical protein
MKFNYREIIVLKNRSSIKNPVSIKFSNLVKLTLFYYWRQYREKQGNCCQVT